MLTSLRALQVGSRALLWHKFKGHGGFGKTWHNIADDTILLGHLAHKSNAHPTHNITVECPSLSPWRRHDRSCIPPWGWPPRDLYTVLRVITTPCLARMPLDS